MPAITAISRLLVCCATLSCCVAGCFAVPVQETTLRNANGGTVTCKQTGTGVVSSSMGKQRYQECIDKAHADGYQ